MVSRVSAGLYVGSWWLGLASGVGLTLVAVNRPALAELFWICWAPFLVSAASFLLLLYKAWDAIRDGVTRITPGKAIGYLFIPVFNVFWLFVAVGGWPGAFNAFAARQRLESFKASRALFVCHCAFLLLPVVILTPVTGTMLMAQLAAGINAVADQGCPSPLPAGNRPPGAGERHPATDRENLPDGRASQG